MRTKERQENEAQAESKSIVVPVKVLYISSTENVYLKHDCIMFRKEQKATRVVSASDIE